MPVFGLGSDVVRLSRFTRLVQSHGLLSTYIQKFCKRILHESELQKYNALAAQQDFVGSARYLASVWATKEALYKSLGDAQQARFAFRNWYKYNDPKGRPKIGCNKPLEDEFLVSVSDDGDYVIATVIRQGDRATVKSS